MTTVISKELIRNSMLFKAVSDDVIQEVLPFCQPMELAAGETLFPQDSASDALYILASGQIHVVRQYPDGDEVILATEGPYYVIGELSMIANLPRTGSVVAVSDCELVKIKRDDIVAVCQQRPDVSLEALTHLGQRIYRLNLRVRESAVGNMEARLANALLLMAPDEAGDVSGRVSVNRLARATAMESDQINKLLKNWTAAGLLSYDHQRLTIHDVQALRNLAG